MKNKTIQEKNVLKENDKVWFSDCGKDKEDKLKWYAEYGTIEAVKNNGDFVVNSYFGMFVLQKGQAFKTKEECENYISLYKENEYYED